MGCSDYESVITVCKEGMKPWSLRIGDFVRLPDALSYGVWDSHVQRFVRIRQVISNPPTDKWLKLTLSDGHTLTLTPDHYLPVNNNRTRVDQIKVGDKIPRGIYPVAWDNPATDFPQNQSWYWLLGLIIRDGSYHGQLTISVGPDEADLAITAMQCMRSLGLYSKLMYRQRGEKGEYLDICGIRTGEFNRSLAMLFGAHNKQERTIPYSVFAAPRSCRMSFLCGMIDGDGHVHNRNGITRIQLGTTNRGLALQTYALAQNLGLIAKIYASLYGRGQDFIRYSVEIQPTPELVINLMCAKKRVRLDTCRGFSQLNIEQELTVLKIEQENIYRPSYCLETETDMFDINGVQSHNCRTRVIGNVHDPKRQWSYGRGNLFPVTLNLPYIALEAKEYVESHPDIAILDKFYNVLTERMNDCFGQLLERFEIVAKRKAKNYPFLMGQGLYLDADKLHPDDEIREVIKHGTLTVGFIGLAETLVVLTGKHHGESEESWNIGYKIIEYMNNMCKQKAEDTKLNFSLMGSPAEGCAGRLLRCTRDKFGTIEGVTNHEYLTNSHH